MYRKENGLLEDNIIFPETQFRIEFRQKKSKDCHHLPLIMYPKKVSSVNRPIFTMIEFSSVTKDVVPSKAH